MAPDPAPAARPAGADVPLPPPFAQREIRKPDPSQPAPSQTAAFCSDEHWSHLAARVTPGDAGEFRIDPATWEQSLTGTRAGIASWMAQCRGNGESVRIVAADSGALLATYDVRSGLREPAPGARAALD